MATKQTGPGEELAFRDMELPNDNGEGIPIKGRLTAESSHYDEGCGILTKERLYLTDDGRTAYSVVMSDGESKERRSYLIETDVSGNCIISDGVLRIPVHQDMLLTILSLAFESLPEAEDETLETLRRKLEA
ncbi:MAG: hypothetical protein ACOCVM_03840, partial [Desulfovibrionaceae bacterium]